MVRQCALSIAWRVDTRFRGSSVLGVDQEFGVDWSLGFFIFPLRTARMKAAVWEGLGLGDLIFGII